MISAAGFADAAAAAADTVTVDAGSFMRFPGTAVNKACFHTADSPGILLFPGRSRNLRFCLFRKRNIFECGADLRFESLGMMFSLPDGRKVFRILRVLGNILLFLF